MLSLFLGLHAANILLLLIVFGLGLSATNDGTATSLYAYHIALGIASGMMALLAHLAVYTYFMATSKWLQAATDKAVLDPLTFVSPATARKRRAFVAAMAAIAAVMLAMFAGAAADPTVNPWWPGEVHLIAAAIAITVNLAAAAVEFGLIKAQGRTMDEALAILNATPDVEVQGA